MPATSHAFRECDRQRQLTRLLKVKFHSLTSRLIYSEDNIADLPSRGKDLSDNEAYPRFQASCCIMFSTLFYANLLECIGELPKVPNGGPL